MSHQHHHSDLVKAVMGNLTEYQMPPTEETKSFWFGDMEFSKLSAKKKVPIAVGSIWEDQDGMEERVSKAVYHPDHKTFDVLYKISMEAFLPEVKVKDEYQGRIKICWPRYAIFMFIKLLELLLGEERAITTFESHSLLIKSQYDSSSEFKHEFEWNVGNREELLEWSDTLPLSKVKFSLPFSFAKDPRLAIPLFLHRDKVFSLHGIFRTQLDKILRMKDGEEDIPFNGEYIEGKYFTVPKMSGYYTKLSQDEKEDILDAIQQKEVCREYDDFIAETVDDDEIDLEDITPTKNVFWFVQRDEAVRNNDFTNFLDSEGKQVIKSANIFLSKTPQPLVSLDELEMNENLLSQANKRPVVEGIWFYSAGVGKLFSMNSPMTIQFKGLHARLKIYLANGEKEEKRRKRGIQKDNEVYHLTRIIHVVKRIYYTMENGKVNISVQDESGAHIKDLQKQLLDILE